MNKNGRGPATPLVMPTEHRPCTCKLFLCMLSYCKNSFEKISNRFPVAQLQRFFADIPNHIIMSNFTIIFLYILFWWQVETLLWTPIVNLIPVRWTDMWRSNNIVKYIYVFIFQIYICCLVVYMIDSIILI